MKIIKIQLHLSLKYYFFEVRDGMLYLKYNHHRHGKLVILFFSHTWENNVVIAVVYSCNINGEFQVIQRLPFKSIIKTWSMLKKHAIWRYLNVIYSEKYDGWFETCQIHQSLKLNSDHLRRLQFFSQCEARFTNLTAVVFGRDGWEQRQVSNEVKAISWFM